ncbi:hypothetical protein GCM10020254_07570 [Streptomyces goshikiensis]
MLSELEYSYREPGRKRSGSSATKSRSRRGSKTWRGVGGEDGHELGVGGVVGQAAGVRQELAQRHRAPGSRLSGQPVGDGVVEGQPALVDEPEGDGAAERLGDAGDPHVVVRARRTAGGDVADAGGVHLRTVAPREQGDHPGRAVVLGDEPVELALQALVVPRRAAVGSLRGLEQRRAEHGGGEGDDGERGAQAVAAGADGHVRISLGAVGGCGGGRVEGRRPGPGPGPGDPAAAPACLAGQEPQPAAARPGQGRSADAAHRYVRLSAGTSGNDRQGFHRAGPTLFPVRADKKQINFERMAVECPGT